jgi:hypothetical protein
MAISFSDFLNSQERSSTHAFSPSPWYNRTGDCVQFYFSQDESYAQRVDGILTVYRSLRDENEIVGCKIKGVLSLIKRFGDFNFQLHTGRISLSMLFIGSLAWGDHSAQDLPNREDVYKDLARRIGREEIAVPEMAGA